MYKMEVFFDYACPYCLRGHEYLKKLHPHYPEIEIVWRPVESHPRPDRYGPHSDLCIRGMFFAMDAGADIWEYHDRMYSAALKNRINVEDAAELANCVRGLLDGEAFLKALLKGEYTDALIETNRYAEQSGVWVVPAYRLGRKKMDSAEDVGITQKQLSAFMDEGRAQA